MELKDMYLALYRKYRPLTFDDVISQPHITVTLQNQIKSGNIAHAYMFTGSRGTGKTTCAKILAREVNGLGSDSADDFTDIQEIDAASNSKVEDMRALLSEVSYLPTELKYKVYIIDEVHMLSASAFNALLKTLEEPPPHVIFILATTDIHKVPATILSRCQRYEFHRINSDESAARLLKIAAKENIALDEDAALLIARLSDGGMRDALSLLDMAASENSTITQQVIRDSAGIVGKKHLFAIVQAISAGDGKTALTIMNELYAKSKDPARLVDELLQHFRNLMIIKVCGGFDSALVTALPEEVGEYEQQAELFSIQAIMDCLDKLADCLRIKGRKIETEICLMKLSQCTMYSVQCTVDEPKGVTVAPPPVRVSEPPPPPSVRIVEPPPPPPPVRNVEPVPPPPPPPPPVQAPEPPKPQIVNLTPIDWWGSVLERLDAYKASMLEEAQANMSGNTVVITGSDVLQFFFDNPDNSAAISQVVREVAGEDYKVVFDKQGGDFVSQATAPQTIPKQQEKPEQTQSKLDTFLTQAESSGIQMSII